MGRAFGAGIRAAEKERGGNGRDWRGGGRGECRRAGWPHGAVNGQADVPHYFPESVVAQVAAAAYGARFRRRHPSVEEGTGAQLPDLTAGWTSECRMAGKSIVGNVNLLKTETEMRG